MLCNRPFWAVVPSIAFMLAALSTATIIAAESQPNVVIIVADDMGYADVGFHGCKDIPTPNLDSLAAGGVRFTNGYVTGLYCSPTRAGLMTGRYQQRFGHETNGGGPGGGLPISETTIADRLKAAGYVTGAVGKWHLGANPEFHPQRRGFDEFFGFLAGAHTYFAQGRPSVLRGTEPVDEKEYLTDAFGREAVAFIERHKDQPFFLYLAFNAVHTPMEATDERLAKFASTEDPKRRTYAAMLYAMDEAIGRVLKTLEASGLEKKTLVTFCSDNGGPTMPGTTINASSNAPLRGSKRTSLEGGIHVPFVLRWTGKLPAGKVYESPVIQLDLLPTALAAAGVKPDPEWKLDGVDLLPYLLGEKQGKPHDTLYWRMNQQMAIRQGDWKLVRYDPAVDSGETSRGDRSGVSPARLYNLAADIGESNDLAATEPARLQQLQAAWDAWNAQLPEPPPAVKAGPARKGRRPAGR